MKVRKMLIKRGVQNVSVVKVDASDKGCVHGVEFNEFDMFTVISVLKENGIKYSINNV
jgi:hypothetical protein